MKEFELKVVDGEPAVVIPIKMGFIGLPIGSFDDRQLEVTVRITKQEIIEAFAHLVESKPNQQPSRLQIEWRSFS